MCQPGRSTGRRAGQKNSAPHEKNWHQIFSCGGFSEMCGASQLFRRGYLFTTLRVSCPTLMMYTPLVKLLRSKVPLSLALSTRSPFML